MRLHSNVIEAFNSGEPSKRSVNNTVSVKASVGLILLLHGNAIAIRQKGRLYVSTAGWDTVTTRERLNHVQGVRVWHDRGRLFLNGKEWGGDWVRITPTGFVSDSPNKDD